MFKRLLDVLLQQVNKLVADWIEPITSDQVDISGFLSGHVDIRHLQLRQKITDFFPLPARLIFNYVGRVNVSVSLFSIFTQPVTATVDTVILVVETRDSFQWDKKGFQDRFLTLKKASLKGAETAALLSSLENGVVWRLMMQLARNICVTVRHVHVRFEDQITRHEKPFALGLGIREVQLTGASWQDYTEAPPVSDKSNLIPKKVEVVGLGVYIEDLRTNVPFGTNLTEPFSPSEEGEPDDHGSLLAAETSFHGRGDGERRPSHAQGSLLSAAPTKLFESASSVAPTALLDSGQVAAPALAQAGSKLPEESQEERPSRWRWFSFFSRKKPSSPEVEREHDKPEAIKSAGGLSIASPGEGISQPFYTRLTDKPEQGPLVSPEVPGFNCAGSEGFMKNRYAFDGRVPWHRLLAPFCTRLVYNVEEGAWIRHPGEPVDSGVPAHLAAGAPDHAPSNRCRSNCREMEDVEENTTTVNYYADTDASGFRRLTPVEDFSEVPEEDHKGPTNGSAASSKVEDDQDFTHEGVGGILTNDPSEGPPSLRIRFDMLDPLRHVLLRLNDAYHDYVVWPRQFDVLVTLAAVPVNPDTAQARSWSDWAEARRPKEELLETLPQCHVAMTLTGLRVTVCDWQALHAIKWGEYCFLLYGQWSAAARAELEVPWPSEAEKERYLAEWPVKLLQGDKAPEGVRNWCEEFEQRYSMRAISVIRRKALGDIQKLVTSGHEETSHTSDLYEPVAPSATGSTSVSSHDSARITPRSVASPQLSSVAEPDLGLSTGSPFLSGGGLETAQSGEVSGELSGSGPANDAKCCHPCASREPCTCSKWCFACYRPSDIDTKELQVGEPSHILSAAVFGLRELFANDKELEKALRRLRPVRFVTEMVLDVVVLDATLTFSLTSGRRHCDIGKETSTNACLKPAKAVTVLLSCCHVYLKSQSISDQDTSLNMELYPISILCVVPHAPVETRPLLVTSLDANHWIVMSKAAEKQKPQNKRRFFWQKSQNSTDSYKTTVDAFRHIEPGIFIRIDTQLYRTVAKPDMRLVFRSTEEIVFFVFPQQLLLLLRESMRTLDGVTRQEFAAAAATTAEASLQAGADFATSIESDVKHANAEFDIRLERTCQVVLARSPGFPAEALVMDFGAFRVSSALAPQKVDYPLQPGLQEITDVYRATVTQLQLFRVSCWTHILSHLIVYSGAVEFRPAQDLFSPFFSTTSSKEGGDQTTSVLQEPSSTRAASRSCQKSVDGFDYRVSYMLYPISEIAVTVTVAHKPFRHRLPVIHADMLQKELQIDVSSYDIHFLLFLASECMDIYFTFADELEAVLNRGPMEWDSDSRDDSRSVVCQLTHCPTVPRFDIRSHSGSIPNHDGSQTLLSKKQFSRFERVVSAAMTDAHLKHHDAIRKRTPNPVSIQPKGSFLGPSAHEFPTTENLPPSVDLQIHLHFGLSRIHFRLLKEHNPATGGLTSPQVHAAEGCQQAESSHKQASNNSSAAFSQKREGYAVTRNRKNSSLLVVPMETAGFWLDDRTVPLLALTVHGFGAVVHYSFAGTLEFRGGVASVILDECLNLSHSAFSSLYSSCTSFTPSKDIQLYTDTLHGIPPKRTNNASVPQSSLEDLESMFGTLGVISNLNSVTCPAASMGINAHHIAVYYHGNLNGKNHNLLASLGSFRLVALWEILDELVLWATPFLDASHNFPTRVDVETFASPSHSCRKPQVAKPCSTNIEKLEGQMSGLPESQKSGQEQTGNFHQTQSGLAYLLRAGVKLGVMVSPFEILLPCEPLRRPVRDFVSAVDRSIRSQSINSKATGITTSRQGATLGGTRHATFRPDGGLSDKANTPSISRWKRLAYCVMHNPSGNRISGFDQFTASPQFSELPACVALKAAIEVKATLFFYVPKGSQDLEKTPSSIHGDGCSPRKRLHFEAIPTVITSRGAHCDASSEMPNSNHLYHFDKPPSEPINAVDQASRAAPFSSSNDEEVSTLSISDGYDPQPDHPQLFETDASPPIEEQHMWLVPGGKDGLFEEVERYMENHPLPLLDIFCPCSLKIGFTVTELVMATTSFKAATPFRFPRIDWNSFSQTALPLIAPLRFELDANLFIPSSKCLYERAHGITPQVANILRSSRGLFISKYPEGVEAMINIEPVVVNLTSESCLLLYQLSALLAEFSTHLNHFLGNSPSESFERGTSSVRFAPEGSTLAANGVTAVDSLRNHVFGRPEDFALNLARTFSVEVGFKCDLARLNLWDVFSTQRRCCLSADIETICLTLVLTPERHTLPDIHDFWWNAFNAPQSVFYCSFFGNLVDEPFDFSSLENPFALRRRKARQFMARTGSQVRAAWARTRRKLPNSGRGNGADGDAPEGHGNFEGALSNTALGKPNQNYAASAGFQTGGDERSGRFGGHRLGGGVLEEPNESLGCFTSDGEKKSMWIFAQGGFLFNAEYLNRAEKLTYVALEPFSLHLEGRKERPDAPSALSVYGTWINLNINVALIDALLTFGFSLINAALRQRQKLLLDNLMNYFSSKKRRISNETRNVSIDAGEGGGTDTLADGTHRGYSKDTARAARSIPFNETANSAAILQAPYYVQNPLVTYLRLENNIYFFRPPPRFNPLLCLLKALDLSIIGDAILAKSSTFLHPAAGFAGDVLQLQQMTQEQQRKEVQNSVLGAALGAKQKAALEARSMPQLYNLLGQPIAVYTECLRRRVTTDDKGHCTSRSQTEKILTANRAWRFLDDNHSLPLYQDDNGHIAHFVIRLNLLNCVFDIPSSLLKLDQEQFELLTLRLDGGPHRQDRGQPWKSPLEVYLEQHYPEFSRQRCPIEETGAPCAEERKETSHHASHSRDSMGRSSNSAGSRDTTTPLASRVSPRCDTRWNLRELPRPRKAVQILVRTSQRLTSAERVCYDIFLTSAVVIRNNTLLDLSIFSTTPGPFESQPRYSALSLFHFRPLLPDTTDRPKDHPIRAPRHMTPSAFSGAAVARLRHPLGGTGARLWPMLRPTRRYGVLQAIQNIEKAEFVKYNTAGNEISEGNASPPGNADPAIPARQSSHPSRTSSVDNGSTNPDDAFSTSQQQIIYGTLLEHHTAEALRFQPYEESVKPVPLYWLALENAPLWVCDGEEKLFTLADTRDLVEDVERVDLLLKKDVLQRCAHHEPLTKRHHDLLAAYEPRLIHLFNDNGTRIALSASVALVGSKASGSFGHFAEVQLEHCFEFCNRLPRPVHILRQGGFQEQRPFYELQHGATTKQNVLRIRTGISRSDAFESQGSNFSGQNSTPVGIVTGGLRGNPGEGRFSQPKTLPRGRSGGRYRQQPAHTNGASSGTRKSLLRKTNTSSDEDVNMSESAGIADTIDIVDQKSFTLHPGQSISLPIDPDSIIVTLDQFVSKPLKIDFLTTNTSVSQVVLHRKPTGRGPSHTRGLTSTAGGGPAQQMLESDDDDNDGSDQATSNTSSRAVPDPLQHEANNDLAALRVAVQYSTVLNSKRYSATTEVWRKTMNCFTRSVTFYAEAWGVNRLDYPIRLNRFDLNQSLCVPPHSRAIIPTDFVQNKMFISIESRHFDKIPYIERYPLRGQNWFFGSQPTSAVSEEFTISDLATKPVTVKRSAAHPKLSYTTCMFSAPSPFLRTTVLEILPAFVLYNERNIPLWIREDVVTPSTLHSDKTNMVAYFHLLPGQAIEFHPQLNRTSVRIQVSGHPKVEEFFLKVIKPILKTYYASYSFQTTNFNRDALWWSTPIDISHPRVVQVRHPSVPTTAGQTCEFSLTEVEITVHNGTCFVRLMESNVPEYRLINLTNHYIAFGQQDCDSFEVLRPIPENYRSAIARLNEPRRHRHSDDQSAGVMENDEIQLRRGQELLDLLSLPFSWYNPKKVPRRLTTWLVVERNLWQARRTKGGGDVLPGGENDANQELESRRDFAFSVVAEARKRAAQEYKEDPPDNSSSASMRSLHETSNMIALKPHHPPKRNPNALAKSSNVPNATVTVTVDASQIRIWGRAREKKGIVQNLDIDSLFYTLKHSRHRPRAAVVIPMRLWNSVSLDIEPTKRASDPADVTIADTYSGKRTSPSSTTKKGFGPEDPNDVDAPVILTLLRFRVIAGSKTIFFEEFHGDDNQSHAYPFLGSPQLKFGFGNLPMGPAFARRFHGFDNAETGTQAERADIKNRTAQLWVKVQQDEDAIPMLARYVGLHAAAREELNRVWQSGAVDVKLAFAKQLENEFGIPKTNVEEFLKQSDTTHHNVLSDRGLPAGPLRTASGAFSPQDATTSIITQGLADQAGPVSLSSVAVSPKAFNPTTECHLNIEGIGISFIDQLPSEFLYVSLARVFAHLSLRAEEMRVHATLGWVQIDNPSETAYYPTVLRPITGAIPGAYGSAGIDETSVLDVEVIRKVSTPTLQTERVLLEIPKIAVFLRPLSVNVDFQMINSLLTFVDDVLTTMDVEILSTSVRDLQLSQTDSESPEWRKLLGPPLCILDTGTQLDKVFISSFTIGKLAFIVNIRCGDQRGGVRNVEEQPKTEVIRAILAALNVRASISDAHLVLARRDHKDICAPLDRLVEEIALSYVGLAGGQLYKVLGAIDLLGNPALVAKHITSGIENGVIELRKGLATGRADRSAVGFGRAACAVLVGCTAAFFDFSTRCFGSWYGITDMVARNTDRYSYNPELIKHGGLLDQPRNCFEGAWVGCQSCFLNFGLSLTNILYKPYKGAQLALEEAVERETFLEKSAACLTGCGRGTLSGIASICGLPSSVLLLGQFTSSGILNQVSSVPMLSSVRPRRVFTDGASKLKSYSPGHAFCAQLLRLMSDIPATHVNVIISLDPPIARLSLLDRCKRKFRFTTASAQCPNEFLGIGPRRLGFFSHKTLVWDFLHTDVVSIEVVALSSALPNATFDSAQTAKRTTFLSRRSIPSSTASPRNTRTGRASSETQRQIQTTTTVGVRGGRTLRSPTLGRRLSKALGSYRTRIRQIAMKTQQRLQYASRQRRLRDTPSISYYIKFILREKKIHGTQSNGLHVQPTLPTVRSPSTLDHHHSAKSQQQKADFVAPCPRPVSATEPAIESTSQNPPQSHSFRDGSSLTSPQSLAAPLGTATSNSHHPPSSGSQCPLSEAPSSSYGVEEALSGDRFSEDALFLDDTGDIQTPLNDGYNPSSSSVNPSHNLQSPSARNRPTTSFSDTHISISSRDSLLGSHDPSFMNDAESLPSHAAKGPGFIRWAPQPVTTFSTITPLPSEGLSTNLPNNQSQVHRNLTSSSSHIRRGSPSHPDTTLHDLQTLQNKPVARRVAVPPRSHFLICPDKLTAMETFSFLSYYLQNEIYTTRGGSHSHRKASTSKTAI